jgi:hypothetical protein
MSTRSETLAQALTTLIHDEKSTYARVARPGRLSRNTVRLIALGIVERPNESTLVKMALGLSVHPYTGAVDRKVLTRALVRLGRASGHQNIGEQWVRDEIPILLTVVTGSFERSEAWVALIAEYPTLDVDAVRRAIEQFGRQAQPTPARKRGEHSRV